MKTNNRFLTSLLKCILLMFCIINNIAAQYEAGHGNFSIPELLISINDPSACNTNDAIIRITQPLGSNYSYSINDGPFQINPWFANLAPGQYSIKFNDSTLSCTSQAKVADINTVPCDLPPEILCKIFTDLKGLILTETSFNIVMPDRISEILASEQLSGSSIAYILSQIKSLDIDISYYTTGGLQYTSANIYNTSMYSDLSSFNIKHWALEISGVDTNNFIGRYQLKITLANGDVIACNQHQLNLTTETIEDEEPEAIENLPLLSCGSKLDELPDENEVLQSANAGDIFYIKAFPILLTEVIRESSGSFSGKGIIPVPFGSRYILVEFHSLDVAVNRKIKRGTVRSISGSPVSCSAPSVEFGGPICIPPQPPKSFSGPGGTDINGYNSYGFDPITKKYSDGSFYDPNGFDFDGNYKGSDPPSPFNDNGCNRDGIDIHGNACDPSPNPTNPEIVRFLEDNDSSFGLIQDTILQQLKHEYALKLQRLNCEQFRSNMNAALSSFSDPFAVRGSSNEYFEPGLSANFDVPIQQSDYDDSRLNPEIEIIGSNHALLYECDRQSIKYNKIIARINAILADPALHSQIVNDIKDAIKRWSEEDLTIYGDTGSQAFKDWMIARLKEKIMEYEDDYSLFSYNAIKNSKQPFRVHRINNAMPYIDYYNAVASINHSFGNTLTISEKEEIEFYFRNGFNTIKGIDRVHYLAAMSQNVSVNGNATPNVMPLKIATSAGSMIYTLYMDNFEFTESTAKFDACIKIEDAESGKILVFRAQNINFGPGSIQDSFRLDLVNDEVSLRINNAAKIHLYKQFTFVEFNCDGFVRAGIKADVEFCPEYILPIDENGAIIANTNYRLHIPEITMNKWMEFTYVMDASPFVMTKYENIHWKISNMVIDTDSNAGANIQITPPEGFESAINPNSGSWKGFYVESLNVKFLPDLPSGSNNPLDINVSNLIIDGSGVSAYASVEDDFLNNGLMSGWPFTIDKVTLLALHNNIAGMGFGGLLKLPVFNEKMEYLAEVYSGGKYKFAVKLTDQLTCPLFKAQATINDDSEVVVVYDGSEFIATATLNGTLKVSNDIIPEVNGVFPNIAFTGMQVSTKAPYFNIGTWDIKGDGVSLDFGSFDIGIGLPQGYKPDGDNSNGVILPVRLELDGTYRIYASGNFAILGKMEGADGGEHKWKYVGREINKFCIGGSFPGVKSIDGCLTYFENDITFGTGFQAGVQVEFEKFLNRISATGCFGKAPSGFKYFFVDATASLQKAIPLGAISLNGFCGGVSYHMASTFNSGALNFTDDFDLTMLPTGSSVSGISYVPDASVGLGLRAGATFVLSSLPSLTNGSLLINMDFASAGGLQEFSMKGTARFLNLPAELLPFDTPNDISEIEGSLVAIVDLKVNRSEIFGKFECYLNAGFMEGIGNQGKVVDAVVKFAPGEWYIWIGQPDPVSLRAGIMLNLEVVQQEVKAYFCMGSKIPNFPDIPYAIRQHIPSFASASSLRGGGGGLVFGSSFNAKAHINAIVASATVEAAAGFDIMLRDYGSMRCAGRPNETIGLNGWYGAGQAWALLSGKLDISGINIFKATIAAAFQARLPNPTFMEAAVSLEACFIKCFDVDMHITIGENCEIQSNDPNNVLGTDVVSSIIPFTNTQDLALESKPQIFFNVPVKDGVKIQDLAGNEKTYNIRVKNLELNSLSLNIPLAFEVSFNTSLTLATIYPKYMLPVGDSIELIIEMEVMEGTTIIQTEEKRVVFHTTSSLPTFANNISLAYPLPDMSNFYKDEVLKEFIVLKQVIYDYIKGAASDIKIKLYPKGSSDGQEIPYSITDYGKKILFDISPVLEISTHYELKFFETESGQEGQSQSDRLLYTLPFRTSKYPTFKDKVQTFSSSEVNGSTEYKGITHKIEFSEEPFDNIELDKRLVRWELIADDYRQEIHDMYKRYTNHSDEFIESHCEIDKLPGCLDCNPFYGYLDKYSVKYNVNWEKEYEVNVVEFLRPYFEKIEKGNEYLPAGDVYDFYLKHINFRDNTGSSVREVSNPNMALMYYTPDGTKVSFQIVP